MYVTYKNEKHSLLFADSAVGSSFATFLPGTDKNVILLIMSSLLANVDARSLLLERLQAVRKLRETAISCTVLWELYGVRSVCCPKTNPRVRFVAFSFWVQQTDSSGNTSYLAKHADGTVRDPSVTRWRKEHSRVQFCVIRKHE